MKFQKCFKVSLVMVVIALIIPGLVLMAEGEKTQQKRVIKGAAVTTVQGFVRHWSDVPKTPLDMRDAPRKMRPILNYERGLPLKQQETRPDTAVQLSGKDKSAELDRHTILQMADPYLTFPGLDFSGWGAGWPPDTTGDVGLTYYVQAVNTSIGIFRKSDGFMVSAATFDDFFDGPAVQGTPCDENNMGDPIVLFDSYSERWFILDFAWYANHAGGSYYSIAVSQTSNPLGSWYLYAFNADPNLMNDYPKCGVWHDAIYITANMFTWAGSYQGAKVWALKKSDLYSGTINAQSIYDTNYFAWSILPSNAKGATPPAAGTPNYMFSGDASEYGPPSADQICIWEYDVDWAIPGNTTWTGPVFLPTAAFGLTASRVPQQGTANQLDSLYGRLMFPAVYREFSNHASVYLNHVVEYAGRRTKRWYEIRIVGGTPSIYQQGTYAPDIHHRWMGSIAADEDGNIALGYSVSSTSMYPAIRYAAQASIDATAGVLGLGEKTIIDGTGSQTYTNRWGDYTTMSIDPVDDKTFWYTNEYYITSGSNWQTYVGAFKIKPDLWSKDSSADVGDEPNNNTVHFWQSNDMWVRNQNDGFTNQTHQNPEYGQTNYLYVKIRCRDSEGSGIDKVYWAHAGTGLSWPASWTTIGQQATGTLSDGDTTILEFPWNPPDPGGFSNAHFCLLSRIETAPDPPYGMTYPEGTSVGWNTKYNNNIIWKNVTIVDNDPNNGGSGTIWVGNLTEEVATIRLRFEAVPLVRTAANLTAEERDVLDWGTVKVDLGEKLFAAWEAADKNSTGITQDKDAGTVVNVVASEAQIEDIQLKKGEEFPIQLNFKAFEDSLTDKNEYILDVIQYNFDGKKYNEIGGVRFIVKPPKTTDATDISATE